MQAFYAPCQSELYLLALRLRRFYNEQRSCIVCGAGLSPVGSSPLHHKRVIRRHDDNQQTAPHDAFGVT